MHRPTHETLAFLAPGLLHQLGNQLFAIQGQVQLLPAAADEQRQQLAAAAQRCGDLLRVLRALLGGDAPAHLPIARALGPLFDLGRVALRDAGHRVSWSTAAGDGALQVEASAAVPAVARLVQLLVEALPAGVQGTLVADGRSDRGAAVVRLRYEPQAGTLPFPLAFDEIRARWLASHEPGVATVHCRCANGGIELVFAANGRPLELGA